MQEAVKAVAEALGDTGRILVRESGTEPLVRVMVEALITIPARSMFLTSWKSSRTGATEFECKSETRTRYPANRICGSSFHLITVAKC